MKKQTEKSKQEAEFEAYIDSLRETLISKGYMFLTAIMNPETRDQSILMHGDCDVLCALELSLDDELQKELISTMNNREL